MPCEVRWIAAFSWGVSVNSCVDTDPLARYGVNPALVKRVAAAQPLYAEPDTLRRPVDFDGLPHVLRAGRVEAAGGWKERRNQELVPSEDDKDGSAAASSESFCDCAEHLMNRRLTSA